MLSISPWQLYQLIRQGAVPAVNLGPKSLRVSATVLERIASQGLAVLQLERRVTAERPARLIRVK